MNWLKKVLGSLSPGPDKAAFQPRASRVSLGPLHRIAFRPVQEQRKYDIGNISNGGMMLLEPGAMAESGRSLKGELTIDHDTFELEGKFRYSSMNRAGVEFVKPAPELVSAIERYLRLEFLAMKLRRVDDMYLKPDPRGKVVWLTDGKQNEIFAVVGGRGLMDFHLTFLGHHIHATHDSSIFVGSVEDEEHTNPGHKGSNLVVQDSTAPKEILRLALVFASNATGIPDEVRVPLIARLSEG